MYCDLLRYLKKYLKFWLQAVLLCYDITNYDSFSNLEDWYRLVLRASLTNQVDKPYCCLVGNKSKLRREHCILLLTLPIQTTSSIWLLSTWITTPDLPSRMKWAHISFQQRVGSKYGWHSSKSRRPWQVCHRMQISVFHPNHFHNFYHRFLSTCSLWFNLWIHPWCTRE